MNLQLESIYRQRTTQELQILTMDEHPENDQGQQPRGRRGVRMHGSVQGQNRGRGRGRRGQGQRCISDEIMLSIIALQWLKGAAKNWEIDHICHSAHSREEQGTRRRGVNSKYSFSQLLWCISQNRNEIFKTTCSTSTSSSRLCTS